MADSPNPDTLPSAVQANPLDRMRAEIRAEVMAEMRRELKRSIPPTAEVPPSRIGRATDKAVDNRWTKLATTIGAATALVTALATAFAPWVPAKPEPDPAVEAERKELQRAVEALQSEVAQMHDLLDKSTQRREGLNRVYGDAFCVLGVKSREWECDGVQLLPKPHPKSSAPQIQIRSDAPPPPE